jgi:predicted kinase
LDCWGQPYPFASDQARFYYFNGGGEDPSYAAYDTTRFTVTLMCGLPGSGKDTWVRQHAGDQPVISLDDIRRELKLKPGETTGHAIALAKKRMEGYLRADTPFVLNATHTTRLWRRPLIEQCASREARVRIVWVRTPLPVTLRRNAARRDPVPANIIQKMLEHFEPPDETQAHEVVIVDAN